MNKKLFLFLLVLLVSAACLFAGGSKEEAPAAQTETVSDTLRVALNSEPSVLFPEYGYSIETAIIGCCLYDTLAIWDSESMSAKPGLATKWEWIDPTHIRFTLRDDVTFADGTPLTADDVLYSFEVGSKYNNAPAYSRVFDAANFKVEDDQNIIIALNAPYPTLLDIISNDVYGIISRSATEAVGGPDQAIRNPLNGSGKYKFVEWIDGQYIKLERNDNYWNKSEIPYYKNIVFTFINDSASRAMAVESGDVDIASRLSASQVAGLKNNSAVKVIVANSSTNYSFYMNCSKGPLANEKVREAIYYLLDASAVRAISNAGYGELSETSFSKFNPVYAAPPAGYTRKVDVAKAKSLIAEAGYPNGFDLNFMIVGEGSNTMTAEIVQANLAEGGINVSVDLLEIGSYLGRLFPGNFETTVTLGDQWDYAKLLYAVDGRLKPEQVGGGAQYYSDELVALIDKAYNEIDDAARKKAYADVQAYLRDHYIVIGLCNAISIECTSAGIEGVGFTAAGYPNYVNCRPTK